MLSGNKNIDTKIMYELEDADLVNVCQTNTVARNICRDEYFWMNRTMIKFPYLSLDELNKYRGDRTWSKYYINDLITINSGNATDKMRELSQNGRLDLIKIAVNKGADIKGIPDNDGPGAPIRWASTYGYDDIVKYLVSKGADIEESDMDGPGAPLRWASQNGKLEVVKYLVAKGADINRTSGSPFTPVQWAHNNGEDHVVDYLVSQGALDPRI